MIHRAPHPGYGANQVWVSTPVRDQRTPAQRVSEKKMRTLRGPSYLNFLHYTFSGSRSSNHEPVQ